MTSQYLDRPTRTEAEARADTEKAIELFNTMFPAEAAKRRTEKRLAIHDAIQQLHNACYARFHEGQRLHPNERGDLVALQGMIKRLLDRDASND